MVIFNSYVSLPEGMHYDHIHKVILHYPWLRSAMGRSDVPHGLIIRGLFVVISWVQWWFKANTIDQYIHIYICILYTYIYMCLYTSMYYIYNHVHWTFINQSVLIYLYSFIGIWFTKHIKNRKCQSPLMVDAYNTIPSYKTYKDIDWGITRCLTLLRWNWSFTTSSGELCPQSHGSQIFQKGSFMGPLQHDVYWLVNNVFLQRNICIDMILYIYT